MFGFKKKHEKLIDEVKSAVTKFREFSLEHPEIPSTYTMEGFENILKDLENVKKVIDQKLVFDEGKIVERGTHDELIQIENGKYRHLYELQIGLHK